MVNNKDDFDSSPSISVDEGGRKRNNSIGVLPLVFLVIVPAFLYIIELFFYSLGASSRVIILPLAIGYVLSIIGRIKYPSIYSKIVFRVGSLIMLYLLLSHIAIRALVYIIWQR